MIRVIVQGAAGRMGRLICQAVIDDPELELIGAVEKKGSGCVGMDIGEMLGQGRLGISLVDGLDTLATKGDVLIDFSSPHATLGAIATAVPHSLALVIGTTGFSQEDLEIIEQAAQKIPCLLSPNMSIGINLLFSLLEKVAPILGDSYDIEIVEAHHRYKVDAPSGTALKMAEILGKCLGRDLERFTSYGRKGTIGTRPKGEIALHAIRGGDIVGEHQVIFAGIGERIELVHRAHNRQTFALGALRAAKWLVKQGPGRLYDMRDVLGF